MYSEGLVNIENYLFEHVDSLSHAGGGGIYIRKDLQYPAKSETITCPDCESLLIEILSNPNLNKKTVTKSLIVGVIYRHPNTPYSKIMQNFSRSNNIFVLTGDYNIDLSKQNIDNKIQNYAKEIYFHLGASL